MRRIRRTLACLIGALAMVVAACSGPVQPSTPTASSPGSGPATATTASKPPVATATPSGRAALPSADAIPTAAPDAREIILATTTSTVDSGLLDVLIPDFERRTGYTVKPLSLGTGQALAQAARGDADVVLVHAPSLEEQFVAEGHGVNRRLVMHNDFVLVGPPGDPAGVKGAGSTAEALRRIAEQQRLFVSRGDNSGTHTLERQLWAEAGVVPSGTWYQETGAGMGQTLNVTSEKGGYTLTDRATYLALKPRLQLEVLLQGDPRLLNIYHVIEVNPEKHPGVNAAGARALADYFVSR
ncbi:MAG TPA: substrate-binding domain-containing protein, partial [Chloroflexota bacterium]